jgi:hypothetical protein
MLAAKEREAAQSIVARASGRFFLLQWMQQCGVRLPAEAGDGPGALKR